MSTSTRITDAEGDHRSGRECAPPLPGARPRWPASTRTSSRSSSLTATPFSTSAGPKVDNEARTLGLHRNELGAFLVQAGLGSSRDHALASVLAATRRSPYDHCGTTGAGHHSTAMPRTTWRRTWLAPADDPPQRRSRSPVTSAPAGGPSTCKPGLRLPDGSMTGTRWLPHGNRSTEQSSGSVSPRNSTAAEPSGTQANGGAAQEGRLVFEVADIVT